jgi:hypothetical protein
MIYQSNFRNCTRKLGRCFCRGKSFESISIIVKLLSRIRVLGSRFIFRRGRAVRFVVAIPGRL